MSESVIYPNRCKKGSPVHQVIELTSCATAKSRPVIDETRDTDPEKVKYGRLQSVRCTYGLGRIRTADLLRVKEPS